MNSHRAASALFLKAAEIFKTEPKVGDRLLATDAVTAKVHTTGTEDRGRTQNVELNYLHLFFLGELKGIASSCLPVWCQNASLMLLSFLYQTLNITN